MNAKQAKLLRRNAAFLANEALDRQPTPKGYVITQHRERLVKTGGLNVDGTPEVRVVAPVTVRNHPDGVRGTYRTLKKLAK